MKTYLVGGMLGAMVVLIVGAAIFFPNQFRQTLAGFGNFSGQFAAVILSHDVKSVADIQSNYASTGSSTIDSDGVGHLSVNPSKKVRILLVPGHEPGFGGAEYGNLKEREMNVELADDLQTLLEANPHYQVFITRDDNAWNPIFADYFKNNWNDIIAWDKAAHAEFSHLLDIGSTTAPVSTVYHNDAPTDVALRLYGITKWADENNIDITIHIHFNDYDRPNTSRPGEYSGFAIYVPAPQYGNSSTTKTIADGIFKRLSDYSRVSNLPGESTGIVDEPDLIAIGANNTADAASMLIEYGYIYRPQFQTSSTRHDTIQHFAQQTYLGLQDFFGAK